MARLTTASGQALDVDWTGSTVAVHTSSTPAPRPHLALHQRLHRASCPCGWQRITHADPGPAARAHAATHNGDVHRIEWRDGEIIAEWADDDPTEGHTWSVGTCPACNRRGEPSRIVQSRHFDLLADGLLGNAPGDQVEPVEPAELDLFTAVGICA